MTPFARSAACAPVARPASPATAIEPISRLLIFIVDLQSQSSVPGDRRWFVETRPHLIVASVLSPRLRPTNDPMHGFARPTLFTPPADATTQRPKSRPCEVVVHRMLQFDHNAGNRPLSEVKQGLTAGV